MVGDKRRRKSLWDVDGDTRHKSGTNEHSSWAGKEHHFSHDSGRYHEFSAPRSFAPSKSRYNAGHSYWEPRVEDSGDLANDSFFINEMSGGNRYFQNMSPGFEGMDRHKYDNSHETSRGHSHSYSERRRSRSRSRSRNRGRSRSRSLSRGRNKEREKGWNRSRSRSRSRSRGYDNVKDQFKSVSNNPSRVCRDFASGRCRKGSQCKFYHSTDLNRGEEQPSQDETTAGWKSKADSAYISKPHNDGTGSDLDASFADPSRGREEPFQTRSSHTIPCREFVKGKCKWGDSCRFLHDLASGESFGQVPRHTPSETENRYQSCSIPKPFCKFFAVGKCGRDNCRFSHEDPKIDRVHAANDYSKRDGSMNDNKISGLSEWRNDSFNQEKQPASLVEAGTIGRGIVPSPPVITEHIANKVETPALQFWMQSQDENRKDKMQGTLQGSTLSLENWQQNGNSGTYVQRTEHQHEVADEVKEFTTTSHSVTSPWQNRNHNLEFGLSQNSELLAPFPNMVTAGIQFENGPAAIVRDDNSVLNHSGFSVQRVENEASHKNAEPVSSNTAKSSPVLLSYNPNTLVANENRMEQSNQIWKMQSIMLSESMKIDFKGSPKLEKLKESAETEMNREEVCEFKQHDADGHGTVEEESISMKDDKTMRLFKNSLVELVKDILKPTWKEGQMSREVHKTIVKKVIDKVTTTIQSDHVPKTRDKVDQYLKCSKTKISKLVQAYVGRSMKKDS